MSFCPHCGNAVDIPLPVEPLYSLVSAAALVPTSVRALTAWLSRHKGDPRLSKPIYRWWQRQRRRLLPASDIRYMRECMTSHVRYPERKLRSQRAQDVTEGDHAASQLIEPGS